MEFKRLMQDIQDERGFTAKNLKITIENWTKPSLSMHNPTSSNQLKFSIFMDEALVSRETITTEQVDYISKETVKKVESSGQSVFLSSATVLSYTALLIAICRTFALTEQRGDPFKSFVIETGDETLFRQLTGSWEAKSMKDMKYVYDQLLDSLFNKTGLFKDLPTTKKIK
jgi:hypothetical protein